MLLYQSSGGSFTYNNHLYSLVKENKKLILRITEVEEPSIDMLPKIATAVNENDNTNDISNEQIGDIVEEKINVKNVIILSIPVLLIIIVVVIIILKKKKNKSA